MRSVGKVVCDGPTLSLAPDSGDPEDTSGDSSVRCALPKRLTNQQHPQGDAAGRFWVVIRGKLGSRGDATVAPDIEDDDWKTKNFVTVFARSGGALLVEGTGGNPHGRDVPGPDRDALDQNDIFRFVLNDPNRPGQPADPNDPESIYLADPVNVTGSLRDKSEDDFYQFGVSNSAIVLKTDRYIASSDQRYDEEVPGFQDGLGRYKHAARLELSLGGKSRLRKLEGPLAGASELPVPIANSDHTLSFITNAFQVPDNQLRRFGLVEYDGDGVVVGNPPMVSEFPVGGPTAQAMRAHPPGCYSHTNHPENGCYVDPNGAPDSIGAKQDPTRGLIIAANVLCYQMRPNAQTCEIGRTESLLPSDFLAKPQVVLFKSDGTPWKALLTDGKFERDASVQAYPPGDGFEWSDFEYPRHSAVAFSPDPNSPLVAFTNRPGKALGPDTTGLSPEGRNAIALTDVCLTSSVQQSRIYVFNYVTDDIVMIPVNHPCISRVSWMSDGRHLVYAARSSAATCAVGPLSNPLCEWTAYKTDIHQVEGEKLILKPRGYFPINAIQWFSPLWIPGGS